MRKITYRIDDWEYMKRQNNLSDEQMENIVPKSNSFRVIYTLYGEKHNIDRYELTNYDGNKIPLDSLNGYQGGIVLNDCKAHFYGGKYFDDAKEPWGVMNITEENI